jgi:hypothetical protein
MFNRELACKYQPDQIMAGLVAPTSSAHFVYFFLSQLTDRERDKN